MSAATKCDRCGKLFEHYDEQGNKVKRIKITRTTIVPLTNFDFSYDLCPECDEEFKKWIKNEEE